MNLALICQPKTDSFIYEQLKTFSKRHIVRRFNEYSAAIDEWADVIWVEWATDDAIITSHETKVPKIVRMHRFEAYENAITQIAWDNVDVLVVSSPGVLSVAERRAPGIRKTRVRLMPVGIDIDTFPLQTHQHGFRIGVLGNIIARKNPWGCLQVLAAAREKDPRYTMTIAGTFQDECLGQWLHYAIDAMKLTDAVTILPQIAHENVPAFWKDLDYCLSASIHDSYTTNVREAMALGVKPIVYEYDGARPQFSPIRCWRTIADAVEMLSWGSEYDAEKYRAWVAKWCSVQGQEAALLQIVEDATNGTG